MHEKVFSNLLPFDDTEVNSFFSGKGDTGASSQYQAAFSPLLWPGNEANCLLAWFVAT